MAKGLIQALAQQLYQTRGQIAVIGFTGNEAKILKTPGKLTSISETWINSISGGGSTHLTQALSAASHLLTHYRKQYPGIMVECLLLTDGLFKELPPALENVVGTTVVDFENSRVRLARAKRLAEYWQADYIKIEQLMDTNRQCSK